MKKSNFNLSHTHLTSFDMGELVPIGLIPVIQGDVFRMSTSMLVRLSPMLAPVMHPTHVTIHHWFVPTRLVWDDFEDFITGGPIGTSAPTFPTVTLPNSGAGGVVAGTLADYLGVPLGYNNDNTGYTVSALPFRSYSMIWNENYRDEDLQTALTVSTASGADSTTNKTLQHACWEKDYYTSSRPSPQKGTAVTLPLGTSAPVSRISNAAGVELYNTGTNTKAADGDIIIAAGNSKMQNGAQFLSIDPMGGLQADLSTATAASISDLRLAESVQKMLENGMRYGSRFVEYLRRYGIKSSDARLQRPEYLGGGKETIQISEVLATSDDAQQGVGSLYGHGIAATRSNSFVRFFEEPGYLVSLAYINPKTIYTQGLARHWNLRTKLDHFQHELQFIGQQAVLNKEVYAPHTTPEATFGYQDRYDHYRRMESRISGMFRESELEYWHFGRSFASSPTLNASFVSSVPSVLPFADQGVDTVLAMVRHSTAAKRIVSGSATPRLT